MEVETGWCDVCKARRRLERERFNSAPHLLLAIITLGIWIPFWLFMAFFRHGWRCIECGSDYVFPGEKKVAEGIAHYRQQDAVASPTTFCTRCGEGLPDGASFCSQCGHHIRTKREG